MDIQNTLSFNGIHIEGCYMNYYFIGKQRGKIKNLVLERTTHYKNTALKPVTTYFQTYKIGTNFQPILEVKISAKAT